MRPKPSLRMSQKSKPLFSYETPGVRSGGTAATGAGCGSADGWICSLIAEGLRQVGVVERQQRPTPQLPEEPPDVQPAHADPGRHVQQPEEGLPLVVERRLDPPEHIEETHGQQSDSDGQQTPPMLLDVAQEQQQE